MISPDGVAPSRMVGVSASVIFPCTIKVQKFSSGTGSPGWSREKGRKMVVCVCKGVNVRCGESGVIRELGGCDVSAQESVGESTKD